MSVGGDVHARCAHAKSHTCRDIKRERKKTTTFRQLPAGARMSQTKLLAGVSGPASLLHQICWCLPWHDLGFTSSQKTNIKCAALCCLFFSTSATVYLLGSPLPLFLQVPDIIIAVRWLIICLLWKLADCLSPVPEELPPPRDFSRKSGTKSGFVGPADAQRGRLRDRLERKMRHGGGGTKKMAMPYFWDVYFNLLEPPHSPICFSARTNGPVCSIGLSECRRRVELRFLVRNAFRKQQYVYFGAGINSSEVLRRWMSRAALTLQFFC